MSTTNRFHHSRIYVITAAALLTYAAQVHGHEEHVHTWLTRSAFLSSEGTQSFLATLLGADKAPFARSPGLSGQPAPFTSAATLPPLYWMKWGSYYEDMFPYFIVDGIPYPYQGIIRGMEHFYTVSQSRTAGRAYALTDETEPSWWLPGLPGGLTNSFAWGTQYRIQGPTLPGVGPNIDTWPDARGW